MRADALPGPPAGEDDGAGGLFVAEHRLEEVIAFYRAQWAVSDELLAGRSWPAHPAASFLTWRTRSMSYVEPSDGSRPTLAESKFRGSRCLMAHEAAGLHVHRSVPPSRITGYQQ